MSVRGGDLAGMIVPIRDWRRDPREDLARLQSEVSRDLDVPRRVRLRRERRRRHAPRGFGRAVCRSVHTCDPGPMRAPRRWRERAWREFLDRWTWDAIALASGPPPRNVSGSRVFQAGRCLQPRGKSDQGLTILPFQVFIRARHRLAWFTICLEVVESHMSIASSMDYRHADGRATRAHHELPPGVRAQASTSAHHAAPGGLEKPLQRLDTARFQGRRGSQIRLVGGAESGKGMVRGPIRIVLRRLHLTMYRYVRNQYGIELPHTASSGGGSSSAIRAASSFTPTRRLATTASSGRTSRSGR